MQTEYLDGLVDDVEPFDADKIKELLENTEVKAVKVFNVDSPEYDKAKKRYSEMTPNQKKRARKKRNKK